MKKLKDLSERFFMSLLAVLFLSSVVLSASFSYAYIFLILLGLFITALASSEWVKLFAMKKINLSKILVMIVVSIQVLAFFFSSLFLKFYALPWMTLFGLMVVLFLFNLQKIEDAMAKIAFSFFPIIYIGFPIGMAMGILVEPYLNGKAWLLYLILVTKLNDIFAYFFGKLFGKAKIVPKVSPKKTIFGTMAGILTSILVSLSFFFLKDLSWFSFFTLSWQQALFWGALFGVGAFFGDISESLLKRDARVKDSSVLPGLGGVLDLLDSLSWNLPILYFYLKYF